MVDDALFRIACERLRQLLLVVEHAVDEHDGRLTDHEGEVENARTFLADVAWKL